MQVVAQHTAGVFASQDLLVHDLRIRLFVSDRALLPPLTLRGGATEPSRSAWSAGSKYSRPNNLSSSPTRSYQTPSYSQDQDEKETTKDAFAEAFLQREDRNRFIGEESLMSLRLLLILILCFVFSHRDILLLLTQSQSVCNIVRAASFHCWGNTCISFTSWRQRLDALASSWKKRLVWTTITITCYGLVGDVFA